MHLVFGERLGDGATVVADKGIGLDEQE